ncbi:hypothetical protein [Micromonospora inyonensis]|uniref:Ribbon-helix-helix protein, copG family n=1 Tax=Micromonospora inyonensis TaxID=47866 RepID=A0A1C6REK1_9ACTN|nr:hypothetical protein [Micromonospora inyonensis]SCL15513.1 hypothetical protein GA0074694_1248 [Micromonospora inyonensis]
MTPVRQESPVGTSGKEGKSAKDAATPRRAVTGAGGKRNKQVKARPARSETKNPTSRTKIAQVRLQPDEVADLEMVVRHLNLGSTSEALREGLRLLVREAAEAQAADEIRAFYEGEQAPLPAGVAPATEAELQAADDTQW